MTDIDVAGIASHEILNRLPEGIAVLSPTLMIVWSNQCFNDWFGGVDRTGQDFYSALGHPEVQGGECVRWRVVFVARCDALRRSRLSRRQ